MAAPASRRRLQPRPLVLHGKTANPGLLCRLYVCRGDALYHSGNAQGLLADYIRACKIDLLRTSKLIVEHLVRDIGANYRLLLANCDKHLGMNPDDVVVFARRGLVRLLVGHDADAQRDFDEFYRKNPHNPMGVVKGLIDEAIRFRERHGSVVPGDTIGLRPPRLGNSSSNGEHSVHPMHSDGPNHLLIR